MFPYVYDLADVFGTVTNLAVLPVASLVDSPPTSTFTVSGPAVQPGSLLTFTHPSAAGVVEIVEVVSHVGSSLVAIRAQEGTSKLDFSTGAVLIQEMTSGLFEGIKTLLKRTQQHTGLVGTSLPATCSPGELYFRTSDLAVFACFSENVWDRLDRTDHGDYSGNSLDTAHSIYFLMAAFEAWHGALPGSHVTSPETHNHQTYPARKVRSGPDATKPLVQNPGDIFIALDTKTLYFSSDGIAWSAYSTIPRATILMFETACPAGWTRLSSLDGKFPKGAPSGAYTGLVQGGSVSHDHSLPTLIAHSHSIPSTSVVVDTSASHSHDVPIYSGSGSNYVAFNPGNAGSTTNMNSSSSGVHTHTASVPNKDSNAFGVAAPRSSLVDVLPPFGEILFCLKD
jgi:hypothetical protein